MHSPFGIFEKKKKTEKINKFSLVEEIDPLGSI